MKSRSHSTVIAAVLAAAVVLGLTSVSYALPSEPMFGAATLMIHGEPFQWAQATEDETWHYDVYTGSGGQTLSVTGMNGFPSLATVSGGGSSGVVDGHLSFGSYADNTQSYAESGTWMQGIHYYTSRTGSVTYVPDLITGALLSSGSETYSGSNGTYSYSWNTDGSSTWSASVYSSDVTSSPSSGQVSFDLFGTTYAFTSGGGSASSESGGDSTGYAWTGAVGGGWTDHYSSADGGSLNISYSWSGYAGSMTMDTTSISGWDPYAGSFSAADAMGAFGGLAGITWGYRTGPSFAPAQLWVGGTLVNWQWGEIASNGTITDHYSQNGSEMLVITGHAREFGAGSGADVTVNGSGAGTYTPSSGFSNNQGHIILTSEPVPDPNPDPNPNPNPGPQPTTSSAPFFTSATVLWVNGTEYPFSQGYEDGYGNRTDTYVNQSAGTVTLAGHTSNANYASMSVSHYGGIDYGYYYGGGTFLTYAYSISTTPPAPDPGPLPPPEPLATPEPLYGPAAFWLRGEFYARSGESNSFQSGTGHTLSLSSGNGGVTMTLSGSDAAGSYNGSFSSGQAGVWVIQDHQGGNTVVVLPANADGTLQLAGDAPPQDFPPALRVTDERIWVFLGMAAEDTAPGLTAAYYGSATAAQASPWLIKLRTDGSGSVIHTDYSTGGSTTGSYNTMTHLLQTSGPQSGFPVPVNGVDPNDNHRLWGLLEPPAGLPATFLVGGQVWRHSGTGANGEALYQGYYDGQSLALGAAGADGLRLVTVADPVHGNTQGTLNDVRGSVRLRNGSVMYSGSFEGQRLNPTFNENNLHTIAADLDITGNVLSFGALQGDAAVAGVTLQFADADGVGTLHSALGRPQAQWVWSRVADGTAQTPLPVMQLDASHQLTLYDPSGNEQPGVVLNPAENGVSKIRGVLRVRPGGDIGMGEFTAGGQP